LKKDDKIIESTINMKKHSFLNYLVWALSFNVLASVQMCIILVGLTTLDITKLYPFTYFLFLAVFIFFSGCFMKDAILKKHPDLLPQPPIFKRIWNGILYVEYGIFILLNLIFFLKK